MNESAGTVWIADDGSGAGWIARSGLPLLPRTGVPLAANSCVVRLSPWALSGGGVSRPGGAGAWEMNRAAGAFRRLSPAEIDRRLRREGLASAVEAPPRSGPVEAAVGGSGVAARGVQAEAAVGGIGVTQRNGQASANRRFTATVFDLEAVDIRRQLPLRDKSAEPDDQLRKIIAKACARALFVLGLDFGQVDIEIGERGRAIIVAISTEMKPAPGEGERRLAAAVARFAAAWAAETRSGVDVMLGADPEFVLMSASGKIVPASRFFPREGGAGCDSVVIRGVRRWPLAELRPIPAAEPAAVAARLRRLLAGAARRTAGTALAWRAGAWPVRGLPLGGHVHLSGAALTGERLRALDNAVALPLRLLEPPGAAARRPRYGALGDFRRQSHGGFEYRTPPSWLVSPRLACGVLALAKVAAVHSRELSARRTLDDDRIRDAFYAGDRQLLLEAAANMRDAILRTAGYTEYRAHIDFIFDAIDRGKVWDETIDIRTKWRIPVDPI